MKFPHISRLLGLVAFCLYLLPIILLTPLDATQPNVIIVLTDDQGIGDLSCHGNPWLKTPNLDQFHSESIRLTDFHVTPMCTPTRGGIMTGLYAINNGAWATYKGRDILQPSTPTIAEVFKENGYVTGLFGKWHLGDNYPSRPTDRGFDLAIQHLSGGVGELSDYWGNDYFDDVYLVNNEPKKFEGYCTDVWFREAIRFIEQNKEQPFLAYIATNAPHDPWIVGEEWAAPYRELAGKKFPSAEFYGMIANIDYNFGLLEEYLEQSGLAENTILIFMTDNGSSGGISRDLEQTVGHNCGFRGWKTRPEEGGHRVPFFIRWPKGLNQTGIDVDDLTTYVDILPTLVGLCGLQSSLWTEGDGIDLTDRLSGKTESIPERTVFVHHNQNTTPPDPLKRSCIMKGNWRLVNGNELYDIKKDRFQRNNLASQFPEVMKELLEDNQSFIAKSQKRLEYKRLPYATVGHPAQPTTVLTIQHAIGDGPGIWKVEDISMAKWSPNSRHRINVYADGAYRVACRRWPKEFPAPYHGVPKLKTRDISEYAELKPNLTTVIIGDLVQHQVANDWVDEVVFEFELKAGEVFLDGFAEIDGKKFGINYLYIEKIE